MAACLDWPVKRRIVPKDRPEAAWIVKSHERPCLETDVDVVVTAKRSFSRHNSQCARHAEMNQKRAVHPLPLTVDQDELSTSGDGLHC